MSILRIITLGGVIGLSTVVVCFVAADRVTHTAFPAPPSLTIAEMRAAEPEATGTITQGSATPEAKPAPAMGGFDTERLNALLRGEMPPPPPTAQTKIAAKTAAKIVAKTAPPDAPKPAGSKR